MSVPWQDTAEDWQIPWSLVESTWSESRGHAEVRWCWYFVIEGLPVSFVEVARLTERVISTKLDTDGEWPRVVVSYYAPHAVISNDGKNEFWEKFGDQVKTTDLEEQF